jgi:hypothetical protein
MAFSRRRHGDEMVSSAVIMAESQNPIKTGLGAEGEEKAILPSPVDCNTYFYTYYPILSSKNLISSILAQAETQSTWPRTGDPLPIN